ncbi:MAG: hypothetical protein R6U70_02315 [Bacillota bacterium]
MRRVLKWAAIGFALLVLLALVFGDGKDDTESMTGPPPQTAAEPETPEVEFEPEEEPEEPEEPEAEEEEPEEPEAEPEEESETEPEPDPATDPEPQSTASFGPGTYLVGEDIQPGRYRCDGGVTYFERLSGLSGEFDDIIANVALPDGPVVVDIEPGTYRTQDDVQYWARLSDFSHEFDAIVANDAMVTGGAIIEIKDADVGFETAGGATWRKTD